MPIEIFRAEKFKFRGEGGERNHRAPLLYTTLLISRMNLLGGGIEVGLEGQCGLEPPTILLHEVEVYGTHQPLFLIDNARLTGGGEGGRGGEVELGVCRRG